MILVALGANLPSTKFGVPPTSLEAALSLLETEGVRVRQRSRWYRSAPVPASDQPWYVNGVAEVETSLSPEELLAALHRIEALFGRRRRERNEPRVLDLDLLAFDERVSKPTDPPPELPHPRLHERAFVLNPLAEIAPGWRHPRLGLPIGEMIRRLPLGHEVAVIDPGISRD
jgi:2-amino-4-hydroxy-6-hydroxymethyldihydropteridine diphosphokinase